MNSRKDEGLQTTATGASNEGEKVTHFIGTSSLPSVAQLCEAPDEFLARFDIAAINLICASGLPGSEILNLDDLLGWIDDAAQKVRVATEANYLKFLDDPAAFGESQANFCVRYLVTVLQRQCGVLYNPKWQGITPDAPIPRDFGRSARDVFIHAIIEGVGGTCGSLPVLYVAVGRRLGYPLKLVKAFRHLFVRWDDPQGHHWFHADQFNIEATGPGVHFLPDEHYKHWPHELTEDDIGAGIYLKSLTPSEELAEFVATRAFCLQNNGRLPEAIEALGWAMQLAPHNRYFAASKQSLTLHMTMRRRGHAFLNAPFVGPFGVDEWPVGPRWVMGSDGHYILVQVPKPWHAPMVPAEPSTLNARLDVPISLVDARAQSPDGHMVDVRVPTYGAARPMQAEWVELPGRRFALVHRPVPHEWHQTAGHRAQDSVCRNGRPILPEDPPAPTYGRVQQHHVAFPMPRRDQPWVVNALQKIRAEEQQALIDNNLPQIPTATIPPGPCLPRYTAFLQ